MPAFTVRDVTQKLEAMGLTGVKISTEGIIAHNDSWSVLFPPSGEPVVTGNPKLDKDEIDMITHDVLQVIFATYDWVAEAHALAMRRIGAMT